MLPIYPAYVFLQYGNAWILLLRLPCWRESAKESKGSSIIIWDLTLNLIAYNKQMLIYMSSKIMKLVKCWKIRLLFMAYGDNPQN